MPRPKFTMSAQLFLWLVPLLYVYISDAKTLAFFLRPVGTVAEPRQGFFDSIQQTFLPIFVFFFVRSRLLCGWGHEIAPQQLNNADDKNGNEDDPRPKKAGGRQISQRAWQMVRSSKIKRGAPAPASHRNSPPSSSLGWKSFYILKSRCVSLILSTVALSLSRLVLYCICFVFVRLPFSKYRLRPTATSATAVWHLWPAQRTAASTWPAVQRITNYPPPSWKTLWNSTSNVNISTKAKPNKASPFNYPTLSPFFQF